MQEKESTISVRYGWTNLFLGSLFGITWQSLVITNSDPRDRFVFPYLTLMSDSYILFSESSDDEDEKEDDNEEKEEESGPKSYYLRQNKPRTQLYNAPVEGNYWPQGYKSLIEPQRGGLAQW